MKALVSSIILLAVLLQYCFSQDTSIIKYLPLKTGNSWVYNWIYMGNPPTGGTSRSTVTKDTVINAHKYYKCSFPVLGTQYIRADSISGNVYFFNPQGGCTYHPGEVLIDSLFSRKSDTVSFCDLIYRKCIDTGYVTLFGNQYYKKDFEPIMELTASSRFYAKNLGIYFLNMGDPYVTRYSLKGCVINSIVYGDTSMPVGLQQINTSIPENFSLSQNYPNPFNPATKIKFDIPTPLNPPFAKWGTAKPGGFVQLVVYDVLGREIAALVNEQLLPGTYEVVWDASNYTSGVYFYKLIISDASAPLSITRKMVLVK